LSTGNLHNETRLLQQVAEGDRAAYNQLFKKYLPKLVHFLEPLCVGGGIDYQDVIQDIFMFIWERKEALSTIRSFESYIFRMAKNRFLDLLRKENTVQTLHQGYAIVKKEIEQTSQEDNLLYAQYHQTAIAAIQNLSPKLQEVFMLSTQADHSLDEIAQELELPKETVKKRLYMAGQQVKEHLRRHTEWLITILLIFTSSN
jgi:RNA polymerase sigma factor (sigma-70 family)